jgi:ABC-type transporter Mla MlaB component
VLKITITDLPDEQRWSLQGQLVGQWAAELESTWREERRAGDTRKCIVDLIEVTLIDRNGEAVLAEVMSQDAEFIASDVYTKHLLLNLRSELKRSRAKGKQDGGGNQGKGSW